jgi:hypothetical protein
VAASPEEAPAQLPIAFDVDTYGLGAPQPVGQLRHGDSSLAKAAADPLDGGPVGLAPELPAKVIQLAGCLAHRRAGEGVDGGDRPKVPTPIRPTATQSSVA